MIASNKPDPSSIRAVILFLAASFLLYLPWIEAKPPYQLYKTHGKEPSNQNRQREEGVYYGDLQHEIDNHELEIRLLDERLNTQESIIDTLREELKEKSFSHQELFKENVVLIDKRVGSIEKGVSGLGDDLRELQAHANDTAKSMAQYKQKLLEMDAQVALLQSAIDTLFTALQIESGEDRGQTKIYEVKPGDKLEKIARNFNTSVHKIKALNVLSSDRIYVGQKLKIP